MSETLSEVQSTGTVSSETTALAKSDPTDRPIPVWPEGVLAVVAGVTLLVIGLRHRVYLQRKVQEAQRAVEEFQRQGGLDDLTQVAKQAGEFLKSSG